MFYRACSVMEPFEELDLRLVEQFRLDDKAEENWDNPEKGRYIGGGDGADVYHQVSQDVKQSRAVKIINKNKMELHKVNYMREVHALATFSERLHDKHDVFVTFLGWFENSEKIFLTMEYFKFGTLENYVSQPIPENEVKVIAGDILSALKIMHEEKNYTHRDLKPSNIFVFQKPPEAPKWWVKIGDFGISKRATLTTRHVGTDEYMAPEVHGIVEADDPKAPYDKVVDMWSLGCVLYEIATSARLFPTPYDVFKFCDGRFEFPEEALSAKLSKTGVDFVKGLIVSNPKNRLPLGSALQRRWLSGAVGKVLKNGWYGTTVYAQFDPSKHDRHRMERSPWDGEYRVEAMQWLTQHHDNSDNTKFAIAVLPLFLRGRFSGGPLPKIQTTIYATQSSTPPIHPDSNVFKFAVILADLSQIPTERLRQDQEGYYTIKYGLDLIIHSGYIEVSVIFEGNHYEASVEYVY